MFKALRARFGRTSIDDTKAKDREAKRLAKALAAQQAKERHRPNPSQGGEGRV